VTDRIYLGTILGEDNFYYKGVFIEMPRIAESASGSTITVLIQDGKYIYAGQASNIVRYNKGSSSIITQASTLSYGSTVRALIQDEYFLYVGGDNVLKIFKINKSNFTKVLESASLGSSIKALTQDENYVYAACNASSNNKVHKYDKGLTKIAESVDLGTGYTTIYSLSNIGDYIYVSGATKIAKVRKSDLTKVAESETFLHPNYIRYHIQDEDYIYALSGTKIVKLRNSDLVKVVESASSGESNKGLCQDEDYIYSGITELMKYDKLTLSKIVGTGYRDLFNSIDAFAMDDKYIYAGDGGIIYKHLDGYKLEGYRRVE
jgi:hypothetical protein